MKLDGPENHIHDRIIRDGKKAYWAKELHRRIQNPPICRGTSGQGGSAEKEECEEEEASSGVLERSIYSIQGFTSNVSIMARYTCSPFTLLQPCRDRHLRVEFLFKLRASCGDLVLVPFAGCRSRPDLYIYNPITRQYRQVPKFHRQFIVYGNEAPLVHEKLLASSLARMNRQLTRDQFPATSRFEKIQRNM
ncbi:F-box and associated interaction domains-containing protein, partial [Striga asiatica]